MPDVITRVLVGATQEESESRGCARRDRGTETDRDRERKREIEYVCDQKLSSFSLEYLLWEKTTFLDWQKPQKVKFVSTTCNVNM